MIISVLHKEGTGQSILSPLRLVSEAEIKPKTIKNDNKIQSKRKKCKNRKKKCRKRGGKCDENCNPKRVIKIFCKKSKPCVCCKKSKYHKYNASDQSNIFYII